eukprot:TRINITY_DN2961_c0_g1_i2.p1 TRINITY_DN2961_c0_g1~~TRINITY_DN2961_c0_g1_i2.p1  ORF type:complete len:326 (+),score=121.83 TRINITY_DN2961_c0_g1_i2:50-1027(+)
MGKKTFGDLFDEEKQLQSTEAAKPKPAKKAEEPEKKEEVKPKKDHPANDPAIRKARKERRKKEKQEKKIADATKFDEKKEARKQRKEAWDKARQLMKEEEAKSHSHQLVVEETLDALARLQVLINSGIPVGLPGIYDPMSLEDSAKPLGKKRQKSADRMSKSLEYLAAGIQQGVFDPYLLSSRLSGVTTAWLSAFEPILEKSLNKKDAEQIVLWLKGQRSYSGRQKMRHFEMSKEFVQTAKEVNMDAVEEEEEEEEEDEIDEEMEEDMKLAKEAVGEKDESSDEENEKEVREAMKRAAEAEAEDQSIKRPKPSKQKGKKKKAKSS